MKDRSVYLHDVGLVCSLGDQIDDVFARMVAGEHHGLTNTDMFSAGRVLPVGMVRSELPPLETLAPRHRSRCNQLLLAALAQIRAPLAQRYDGIDPSRIGIVLGTSTSGIGEGEGAIVALSDSAGDALSAKASATSRTSSHDGFQYAQQQMGSPAACLADELGATGPAYVISTACSSSAKALASARRLLRLGVCDVVIAGGVDALCGLTVNGFSSLQLVSDRPCQPFSVSRDGINIGEGAALFIVSREPADVELCGVGEGSDAYHFSAPQPQGLGAARVMQSALDDAGLVPEDIGYMNLHGTATPQNDTMESLAVERVLGVQTPCSSTKAYTGHSLGAAGAIEAAICWRTLQRGNTSLPAQYWDAQRDAALPPLNFVHAGMRRDDVRYVMSNSFAFGGNNISLILGRAE